MSANKKYRNTREYLKYLKGELSREERHSFERDLQADPFEREAMDGMEQVSAGELEEDILSIHATLRKRLQRRRRRTLYYAAASVASLLLVGTVFLNIYNINPKSDSEPVPRDETFLHEDLSEPSGEAAQEEVIRQEETPGTDKRPEVQTKSQAPEVTEIIIHEDKAVLEEEGIAAELPDEAPKLYETPDLIETPDLNITPDLYEAEAPEPAAVNRIKEAPEPTAVNRIKEAPEPTAVNRIKEAAEPVQRADELVVMEAQPERSQKKARAGEALAPVSTGRVSGIVVSSEDMEPLPGASIQVKGTDSGQVADMEGRFSLAQGQREEMTVIASYVGMETGEYQLSGGGENRVVMQPDKATLDEVVVIGYEAGKSMVPTGAVQSLTMDKAEMNYRGAEPEGGLEAFKMYMEEQIRFPAGDTTSRREVVVLTFFVESDGSITRIKALRSPGAPFTREAIRLLQEGPSWEPARNENGTAADEVRMRLVFKK